MCPVICILLALSHPQREFNEYTPEGMLIRINRPTRLIDALPPQDTTNAIRILTSDQEVPLTEVECNANQRALRTAAVELELLGPEQAPTFFRHPGENLYDATAIRTRFWNYGHQPRLSHAAKFVSASPFAMDEWVRLGKLRDDLELRSRLWYDRYSWFERELAILDYHRAVWLKVWTIFHASGDCHIKRENLGELKELLTEEEWNLGLIPLYLPSP